MAVRVLDTDTANTVRVDDLTAEPLREADPVVDGDDDTEEQEEVDLLAIIVNFVRSVVDGEGETLADFDAAPLLLGVCEARGDSDGEFEPMGDFERLEETDCEDETRGDSVIPKTVEVASFVLISEIVSIAVVDGVESLERDAHEALTENETIETVAELLASVEILAIGVSDATGLDERVINGDKD